MVNKHREIVLNLMYNGKYLSDDNNIGFEIINLFTDDRGDKYIYLLPYGTYDKKHFEHIESILLVRKLENLPILEILGKATDLYPVYNPTISARENSSIQIQKSNEIFYSGISVREIFEDCKKQEVMITFRAEEVMMPTKSIYLYYSRELKDKKLPLGKYFPIHNVGFPKQAQKQYFTEGEENYNTLQNIIQNAENWKASTEKLNVTAVRENCPHNFFEICGIADRELSFSNALAHFIEYYPELLVKFAKERGVEIIVKNNSIEVRRETESNIDIFLKCDSHIIVIENKIRSGINGIDSREETAFNQLKKYYEYVKETYLEENKKFLFVLLKPDYSSIDISKYQVEIPIEDHYREIKYSEIFKFLKRQLENSSYSSIPYLSDFVAAMQKHTRERYEDKFEEMKNKFERVIRKKKHTYRNGSSI